MPERLPRAVHPQKIRSYTLGGAMQRLRGPGLDDTFTPEVGSARVARAVNWVEDFAASRVSDLRILDLGCKDGGFAIELAKRGATVVGIEGRIENLRAGIQRKEELGLRNLTLVDGDVRELTDAHGDFDVVLCLGLLYHLRAPEVFALAERISSIVTDLAIFETQISLLARQEIRHAGRSYFGDRYAEDTRRPGASLDEPESFWLTKPSLVNLLTDSGFRSVAEAVTPVIPPLAAFADHTVLIAKKEPAATPRGTDRGH